MLLVALTIHESAQDVVFSLKWFALPVAAELETELALDNWSLLGSAEMGRASTVPLSFAGRSALVCMEMLP